MKFASRLPFLAIGLAALGLVSCATTGNRQGRLAPGQYEWHPERSPSGPVLVVVSIDDQMACVYRNGVQIARSTVSTGKQGKETPTGVFMMLEGSEPSDPRFPGLKMHPWSALSLSGSASRNAVGAIRSKVRLPDDFMKKVNRELTPGTILVTTKRSSNASTRSSRDFKIIENE